MQAGVKMPKWAERSRVGVYLGPSWAHAKSVGLILSLTTGLVSPQFHVKYDDAFKSIRRLKLSGSQWQQKCHFVVDPTVPRTLNLPSVSVNEGDSSTYEGTTRLLLPPPAAQPTAPLPYPLPLEPLVEAEPQNIDLGPSLPPPQLAETVPNIPNVDGHQEDLRFPILHEEPAQDGTDMTVRRSNRTRQPSRRLRESYESHYVQVMESTFTEDDDPVTNVHPMLAYATADASDIMTLRQAMQAPDANKFRESMQQEFNDHCEKEHWAFVLRSSIPHGAKVLPSVWAMCRK